MELGRLNVWFLKRVYVGIGMLMLADFGGVIFSLWFVGFVDRIDAFSRYTHLS